MPLEITAHGAVLHCRLTPRSAADRVVGVCDGLIGPALRCTVRAVPEKGRASTALEKLIATWLDVPKSTVTLTSGSRSRYKKLEISGDPEALAQRSAHEIAKLEDNTSFV